MLLIINPIFSDPSVHAWLMKSQYSSPPNIGPGGHYAVNLNEKLQYFDVFGFRENRVVADEERK